MPDELRLQVDPILEGVRRLGLPLIRIDGVEADDVIGTLCRDYTATGRSVLVSTGDKDLAQLVGDRVTLVNTMTDSVLDRDGVKTKFGVWPEQIIDYLALVGDTSDNIPGVPKVGTKTAAKWLGEWDTLDRLIEHAGEIRGKVGDSLREHLDQLRLSRELATIRLDIELPIHIDDLKAGKPDIRALRTLYGRYELRALQRQLDELAYDRSDERATAPAGPAAAAEATARDYETVLDEAAFERWLATLQSAEVVAFDTETTSLDYMAAELVGLSFSVEPGRAAYVPVAHDYDGAPAQLGRDYVLARLKDWLENPEHSKLGHHLKYDAHILARYGITLRGMRYDSMLESYVVNSVATRHDMDSAARHYLGVQTVRFEDVAGKGAKQLTFNKVEIGPAANYAAEDADITLRLHRVLWPLLGESPSLKRVYQEIEQPLVPVLWRMEQTGVRIDRQMLALQSRELRDKMVELERTACELAGETFNLGSPKQLQAILFDKLGLPAVRKTPKGQPSTAEDVLAELAREFDLPRVIIEHRGLAKLRSTYTDRLPEQINARTGRVHTCYHQAVAATGRLSSTDPNLQNIPIRTPEGRRIRQAFIAADGYCLLAADYSQIELRIMAHLSADDGLVSAFAGGEDVHRATAAEVFGVPLDAVTSDQRRSAKAINFGLMYGMSAFGLAKQLGIGRARAQDYVELYFDRYPGVKRYMDDTRETARRQGYVETVFGRRLYLPEINARNAPRRQYAERSAINAPMQGTAADIIKRAMLAVDSWLSGSPVDARMIMQVHDELVFEVAERDVETLAAAVTERMCGAAELRVPLSVETGTGDNWDEAH
jgi:DNA polymerase-1